MTARALTEHLDWPSVKIDKIENGDQTDLTLDELERLSLALHVETADCWHGIRPTSQARVCIQAITRKSPL